MVVRKITGGPGDVPKGPEQAKTGKFGGHEYTTKAPTSLGFHGPQTIKNTYLQSIRKHEGQRLNGDLPEDTQRANDIAQATIAAAA